MAYNNKYAMVKIYQQDNVYLKVLPETTDELYDINKYFTTYAKNFQWSDLYKARKWDGKIKFYNNKTKDLFVGLLPHLLKVLKKNDHPFKIKSLDEMDEYSVSKKEIKEFIKTLELPEGLEERDYQLDYICNSLNSKRSINVSPTGSGKSFMMYVITRYLLEKIGDKKILIIVPGAHLSEQLYTDYQSYGWNLIHKYCSRLYSGMPKEFEKNILITTWQSLARIDREKLSEHIQEVKCIIVDEVHQVEGTKLTQDILKHAVNADIRLGFTGTINLNEKCDQLLFEGLIGPVNKFVSTVELQKENMLSPMKIDMTFIEHPKQKIMTYDKEVDYVEKNEGRKKLLVEELKGKENNTLVLFGRKREYGKSLLQFLREHIKDKEFYYIDGTIPVDQRNIIIDKMEKQHNIILVASFQVFSTGVNVKNIHNIIIWSPLKSEIKLVQSIGRGLRKYPGKMLHIIDFCDIIDPKRENYTLKHGVIRYNCYKREKFDLKHKKVLCPS